jgi:hypothetical protein
VNTAPLTFIGFDILNGIKGGVSLKFIGSGVLYGSKDDIL